MDTLLDSMLNIAVLFGMLVLTVVVYIRAQKKGAIKLAFLCQLAMWPIALAFGERWYHENQSLMWLGGAEQSFLTRTDWGPVFFILLLAIAITILLKWPFNFAGSYWSKHEKLPGTVSPYLTVGFFLALSLYMVAGAGSYLNMSKDIRLGNTIVHSVSLSASETMLAGKDFTDELAAQTNLRSGN